MEIKNHKNREEDRQRESQGNKAKPNNGLVLGLGRDEGMYKKVAGCDSGGRRGGGSFLRLICGAASLVESSRVWCGCGVSGVG